MELIKVLTGVPCSKLMKISWDCANLRRLFLCVISEEGVTFLGRERQVFSCIKLLYVESSREEIDD